MIAWSYSIKVNGTSTDEAHLSLRILVFLLLILLGGLLEAL